jgi:hypothetical protein
LFVRRFGASIQKPSVAWASSVEHRTALPASIPYDELGCGYVGDVESLRRRAEEQSAPQNP